MRPESSTVNVKSATISHKGQAFTKLVMVFLLGGLAGCQQSPSANNTINSPSIESGPSEINGRHLWTPLWMQAVILGIFARSRMLSSVRPR